MSNDADASDDLEAFASEMRLLALATAYSPLGMSLTRVEGTLPMRVDLGLAMVNQALADMLGYTREELLAAFDHATLTHPEDRPSDHARMQRLVDDGVGSDQWEKRYLHRGGHLVWARVSTSVIRAAHGNPLWVVAQVEDITRRREAEKALADTQVELLEEERSKANQLQHALDARIIVEQAKGVLAATHGISVDDALARLRDYARESRMKLVHVANSVVYQGLRP